MGANDKAAATFHGHTPTTGQVRAVYATASPGRWEGRGEEFDRWLEAARAEAKAEALEEAASAYPLMLRDMVSRPSVVGWLRGFATRYKEEQ